MSVKQENVCAPQDCKVLVMSLRKILETFSSSFTKKYVHRVAFSVAFERPASFELIAFPGRKVASSLSYYSKNDGHAVALTLFLMLFVKDLFVWKF